MLARSFGVATSYIDYRDERVVVPAEILRGLVSAISGEKIDEDAGEDDLRRLYNKIRLSKVEKSLPLTIVAWDGAFPKFWSWIEAGAKTAICRLQSEDGLQSQEKEVIFSGMEACRSFGRKNYIRARIEWDSPIPYGYYTFELRTGNGREHESFLISAPAHLPGVEKCWGAFAPAYALRSENTGDIGGFRELSDAARLIKKKGGEFLGTLPLLPLDYDGKNPETSPYSPVSRLFWNEIYLDLNSLPGPYMPDQTPGSDSEKVDYTKTYASKKKALLKAAEAFFEAYPGGDDAFRDYLSKNAHLKDYADFRAQKYPKEAYDAMVKFHLYAQYACHTQLCRIKEEVESGQAAALYLDYTVGVHPDGFDAQRLSGLFLKRYQVGAPPDKTFTQGQGWGFEPLHPRKIEESRYQYLRDCFHHYFQYSKIMRIDHVMGQAWSGKIWALCRKESGKQWSIIKCSGCGSAKTISARTWKNRSQQSSNI